MILRRRKILKLAFASLLAIIVNHVIKSVTTVRYSARDLTAEGIRNFVSIGDMPNISLVNTLFNLTKPGHLGSPVILDPDKLPEDERIKYNTSKKENGYQNYISNLVPVHRKKPLPTPKECQTITYDITRLPQTSVVVIFMNETWITLLRTVHSIIDNTPPGLLKEIVLVDDNSTKEYLLKPLDDYMSRYPLVKIIRTGERVGLIRARIIGFDACTAPTVTFMDSHCECFPGWLEPQLERIAGDDKIVTTPVIETIDKETFSISNNIPFFIIGFFLPNQLFDWMNIPERERKRRKSKIDPIISPGMQGGLFTISRKWFEYLGKYDPGLQIWGGENMELSFKIWMCGGSIEKIPCSKVAHLYRSFPNYDYAGQEKTAIGANIGRVVNVWMDEYRTFHPNWNGSKAALGDLSERRNLRERLQCKSFQWYLDNVHPEMYLLGGGIYAGEIRNVLMSNLCIDGVEFKTSAIVYSCHGQGPQRWDLTEPQEIRNDAHCFDAIDQKIEIKKCHNKRGNQAWQYTNGQIMTIRGDRCVAIDNSLELVLQECDGSALQKWQWKWMREPRKL